MIEIIKKHLIENKLRKFFQIFQKIKKDENNLSNQTIL